MTSMKLQQAPPDAMQLAASMASAWARVALSLCGCAPAEPNPFSAPQTAPETTLCMQISRDFIVSYVTEMGSA